jgi:hypothetical protein
VLRFRIAAGTAVVAAVAALVGCVPPVPIATPSASATPTPSASVDPFGPQPDLVVGGSAIENKALFDWALGKASLVASPDPGRVLLDSLVVVGFDKAAMQLTPSTSGTGQPADQIVISVQIGTSCLIGQRMLDASYTSTVESALGSGGCLIGDNRRIDW